MQFISASILPYVAFNKDAFPQPPAQRAGWTTSISPPKQAQVYSRASFQAKFPSAKSGFRSLCGRKQRSSQKPSRAILTCLLEPFTRAGSRQRALANQISLRELWPMPVVPTCGSIHWDTYGASNPGPMLCRNVVVPEGYSKWFFAIPIGLYQGNFRPVTARRMPARSAFGGPG